MLELIEEWGGVDGSHHKQWLLDQIVRTLTHTEEGYLAWVYEYEYPNGEKHNAEALFADPSTGRLYILTKEDAGQPSVLFRFPLTLSSSVVVTLERVATLPVPSGADPQLTGADVSPCGDAVLVRLYNKLLLFRVPAGGQLEDAFSAPFTQVPVAQEPQGEAVAFAADGRSYFTASEALGGDPPLNQSTCR